ncbi:hypothetical protein AGOR_G00236600 [Albula goreensis]|uniref:Uncharacterized protein n=1 Tax=Albula goreensis TaxID=1534307 RepID=A0A8T3CHS7_9TELE|nr:hypothetical protein AGOR_G00236600 [Albula goreensis]
MRLSPPSNSKLAKRRQKSSLLKGAPVSASELHQLLAPLAEGEFCGEPGRLLERWILRAPGFLKSSALSTLGFPTSQRTKQPQVLFSRGRKAAAGQGDAG